MNKYWKKPTHLRRCLTDRWVEIDSQRRRCIQIVRLLNRLQQLVFGILYAAYNENKDNYTVISHIHHLLQYQIKRDGMTLLRILYSHLFSKFSIFW